MSKTSKKKTIVLYQKTKVAVPKKKTPQSPTETKIQTNQPPLINILKKIYFIIEIFCTLSVLSFVFYFIIGCFSHNNKSDNDLIVEQINKEISKNGEVTSIITDDIHGFGNNSIIATTRTIDFNGGIENNTLIILDLVENKFLHNIHDPFGMKSSYKTTLSYSIDIEGAVPAPQIEYVLDIDRDSTKEVLVRYDYLGSIHGAFSPAIFKYSYEKMQYQLIGTYPICDKLDLATYSDDGVIRSFSTEIIETPLYNYNDNNSMQEVMKCTHDNIDFYFPVYSWSGYRSYWATGIGGTVLVVLQARQDLQDYWNSQPSDYYINIYEPIYDSEENSIKWNIFFSEYCDESIDMWNKNTIETFICQKTNEEIRILTPNK